MVTMLTLFLDWRVQLSHRRGTGTALCALAVATGLVLTGCGTESELVPTAAPTSTETAPSTPEPGKSTDAPEPTAEPTTFEPTPEPTPPDPAQLINENTEEGAKSAAEYFLDEYNFVRATGDLDRWSQLGTEDCAICAEVAEEVEALTKDGQVLFGGEASLRRVLQVEEFVPGVWEVHCMIEQLEAEVQDTTGNTISTIASKDFEAFIFVEFMDEAWALSEIAE
ncbi:DUF6318 family protein [Jonesiaceae bacterium BS-20]|uniref:DUF6318 family protein n=1 Tax=Jonesiaceae bacterium BS-20 TaxID=3120821 RepID=A0AAU7DZ72_9MICO